MGLSVSDLNLQPHVAAIATALDAAFLGLIHFSSGRRTLQSQAHAMAANVYRNRLWVEQTYTRKDRPSYAVACAVQDAIFLSDADSVARLEQVILNVLVNRIDGHQISFHPDGRAFDFDPVPQSENQIRDFLEVQPTFDAFLTQEGGLQIYHAQFLPVTTVEV